MTASVALVTRRSQITGWNNLPQGVGKVCTLFLSCNLWPATIHKTHSARTTAFVSTRNTTSNFEKLVFTALMYWVYQQLQAQSTFSQQTCIQAAATLRTFPAPSPIDIDINLCRSSNLEASNPEKTALNVCCCMKRLLDFGLKYFNNASIVSSSWIAVILWGTIHANTNKEQWYLLAATN